MRSSRLLLPMLVFFAFAVAGVTPAGAVVASIKGRGYGITPIKGVNASSLSKSYRSQRAARRSASASARIYDGPPFGGGPLEYLGGPVMHSTNMHVIYWDPSGEFKATTRGIIGNFFTGVAHDSGLATNVFAITGQYTDTTGNAAYSSTYAGAAEDTEKYPTSGNCTVPNEVDKGPYSTCLFDGQLKTELSRFINEKGLPKGSTQLYFVLLPHSVATCLEEVIEGKQVCSNNFYCAYHSYVSPGTAGEIIYSDIPFSLLDTGFAKGCQDDGNSTIQQPNPDNEGGKNTETRFADVALKYISHEAIEAITDPLVNAPFKTAWVDENGEEIGDKCNGVHGNGSGVGYDSHAFTPILGGEASAGSLFNQAIDGGAFYVQSEWDNAGEACLMRPLAITAATFSSASGLLPGQSVPFNASAVDRYGKPVFSWNFGDGTTGSGAVTSHAYGAPGVYTVTMSVTDALTGSTTAPVQQAVVVNAPPAPPPPVQPAPIPPVTVAVTPNSAFAPPAAAFNAKTGATTFTGSVANAGTFSWLITFQNGKFGVYTASSAKCKKGFVRLGGRCRPAKIVFARGSKAVAAGTFTFVIRPTASGLRALKAAKKQRKGLPLSETFTFQSSLGGSPVVHPQTLTVKLK